MTTPFACFISKQRLFLHKLNCVKNNFGVSATILVVQFLNPATKYATCLKLCHFNDAFTSV